MTDLSSIEQASDAASIGQISELTTLFVSSRCLHLATELGVADCLDDEPQTLAQIAHKVGADAGALDRILRLLAQRGIFKEENGSYSHSPVSRLLRTDHPQSQRSWVCQTGSDTTWGLMGKLGYSLQTGLPATNTLDPPGLFPYLKANPELAQRFDEAMTSKSMADIANILLAYDFSSFQTIADIGGGRGHLLSAVLAETPGVDGVLFDQAPVIEKVEGIASERLTLEPGDFFKTDLPVCDCYLLMNVIHDWSDTEAISILKAVRKAAPANARLLLLEKVIPEECDTAGPLVMDVSMLVLAGGKERKCSEYEELLKGCGWALKRAVPAGIGITILEFGIASGY